MDISKLEWYKIILLLSSFWFHDCSQKQQPIHALSSHHTGVLFNNQIDLDTDFSIIDYMYFFNGAGTALGDFNNDGLEDLFFTGNRVSNALYQNTGNFKFQDVTKEAGLSTSSWCTGALVEDFNQDGWLDLYLSVAGEKNTEMRKNLLYINNKDMTFTESAALYGLDFEDYSTHAAVLDYDLDGDLDVYLLNHTNQFNDVNDPIPRKLDGSAANTDRLLRCDWIDSLDHPVYVDVSTQAGIEVEGFGLGVGVSDFNLDGWPDLYISNDFISNDILYMNQGNGTFVNEINKALKHQSFNGMGNDVADFNNDELPDILVADMLPKTRKSRVMMANNLNTYLQSAAASMGYELQYPRNTLQLNQGAADRASTFSELGQFAGISSTDWSWAPLFVDLNLDGFKDVFISNGYLKDITNQDFIAYRKNRITFSSQKKIDSLYLALMKELSAVEVNNLIFWNQKDSTFQESGIETFVGVSSGAAYGDLDLDGDLDLVTNNSNAKASIFENRISGNSISIKLKGPKYNHRGIGSVITAYVDTQVQKFEYYLSRGYMSTVGETMIIGLGAGKLADSLRVDWYDNTTSRQYGLQSGRSYEIRHDENMPRKRDLEEENLLFVEAQPIRVAHQELDYNDFDSHPLLPWKYSNTGPGLAMSSRDDFGRILFYMTGSQGFNGNFFDFFGRNDESVRARAFVEETDAIFFDCDNDGDEDLYVLSGGIENLNREGAYQDELLINDNGTFTSSTDRIEQTKDPGSKILTIDFDRDGDLDLFRTGQTDVKAYGRPTNSWLYRNDKGIFSSVVGPDFDDLKSLGMVTDVEVVDMNHDDWPDIVVVGEWMEVTILYNNLGKGFKKRSITGSSGIWRSLATGDFDNDGDIDLVVGNLGLNTGLNVSQAYPMDLLGYCLGSDAHCLGIPTAFFALGEGKFESFPLYGRSIMLKALKNLQTACPSYQTYAHFTTQDLMELEQDKILYQTQIQTLNSSYFENKGSGNFITKPLPKAFQWSSVEALLVFDFDDDGYLDLMAAGNNSGMNVAIGDLNASKGILALGTGRGDFKTMSTHLLENFLSGEVRTIKKVRVGEVPYFLAASNNGNLNIFKINPLYKW